MLDIVLSPLVYKIMTDYIFLKFMNPAGALDFSSKPDQIRTSQPKTSRERPAFIHKRPAELNLNMSKLTELNAFNKDHLVIFAVVSPSDCAP